MTTAAMLALLVFVGEASAEPGAPEASDVDEQALELFLVGDAHYKAGRYEQAAASFLESYELSGRPELLYNLANAHERMIDYPAAIEYLEEYLAKGAGDPVSVQERIRRLELAVAESARRDAAPPTEPAAVSRPPVEESESRRSMAPVWGLGGLAVAATASSVTFGLLAQQDRSAALDRCGGGTAEERLCTSDAMEFIDRQASRALVADISTGVAAVSATAALVTWAVRRSRPRSTSLSLAPRLDGGLGIDVAWSTGQRSAKP